MRFGAGQRKADARAFTRFGIHPDAAAVGFDDGAGEEKPQACAFGEAGHIGGAVKAVEDVGDIAGGDAGALIADGPDVPEA